MRISVQLKIQCFSNNNTVVTFHCDWYWYTKKTEPVKLQIKGHLYYYSNYYGYEIVLFIRFLTSTKFKTLLTHSLWLTPTKVRAWPTLGANRHNELGYTQYAINIISAIYSAHSVLLLFYFYSMWICASLDICFINIDIVL